MSPTGAVDGLRHHPHLLALLTYHGQVVHLAIVAFVIGGVPADTIGGSFFLMWVPAAALTAVHWSHLRVTWAATASAQGVPGSSWSVATAGSGATSSKRSRPAPSPLRK